MVSTKKGQNVMGQQETYVYVRCRNMTCNREGRNGSHVQKKINEESFGINEKQ